MPKYWVVGAMWERGKKDQLDAFVRRGYWRLGWSDQDEPAQAALRDQITPGDRIAVKRMLGQGATEIEIRALGVVREIDPEDKRVYVDWAVTDLQRRVESKGCFKSIHGPFVPADDWTREVFQL
jgi:hypothetical protein